MILQVHPSVISLCCVNSALQISEEVFEEVLLSALQADLASAFRTPEQLQLLLVALQRFPQTLKPKKLKKLLGSSTIINSDNTPKYDDRGSLGEHLNGHHTMLHTGTVRHHS